MELNSGSRIGPYEIIAPLGAGGMGEVYRARDTRLDRQVAVKVLPSHLAHDPDFRARFEREAKAVAALTHPNVLAIHDVGVQGEVAYSVSELLEGTTLRARLEGTALPVRKAIDYALQMTAGLAAAHDKGIVHRDLKPENIFITKDGRVKILDFGLAKVVHPESAPQGQTTTHEGATHPGAVMGTVGYMSPEQVRGQPVDVRSDLFSFGSILYEMLTAKRAFGGSTAADTASAILKEDPPTSRAPCRTARPDSSASCCTASRSRRSSASSRRVTWPSRWSPCRPVPSPGPRRRTWRRLSRVAGGGPSSWGCWE